MSLLWLDGFDNYGTTDAGVATPSGILGRYYSYAYSSSSAFYVRPGRVSGKSLGLSYSSVALHLRTPILNNSDYTSCIIGYAVKPQTWSTTVTLLAASDENGAANCFLKQEQGGLLELQRYVSETLAVSTKPILPDQWNYIEWQIELADSATSIVRLNGEVILNATGIDTRSSSTATKVNSFSIYNVGGDTLIDDLYVLNKDSVGASDFLGPIVITPIRPTSDDTSDWSPSTGTDNYALVDDVISDDDSTYVYTSNPGSYDLYGYGDLTYATDIVGLAVKSEVRDDSATSPSLYNAIESGSTTSDGSSTVVSSDSYTGVTRISETDPDTSTAWTVSGVNAANFGLKHA
jgi:hypothetical protein